MHRCGAAFALAACRRWRPAAGPLLALLVAAPAAAQAPFGNTVRIAGVPAEHSLCRSGNNCGVGFYEAVSFRFVPTAAASVKTVTIRTGTNAKGTPLLRIALKTGPLGAGATLSQVDLTGPRDVWLTADFVTAGIPPGPVSVAAGTPYYLVISQPQCGACTGTIVTAPAGTSAPVGETRMIDARTSSSWQLAVFLQPAGGAIWAPELTDRAPVFVATTTAADAWSPAPCGVVDAPFGNPYFLFGTGIDLSGVAATAVSQKFFHTGAAAGATGLQVHLGSVAGPGPITASLSDGARTVQTALAAGIAVDGYTAYTGTFADQLRLDAALAYTLSLTAPAGTTFAARAVGSGVAGTATDCAATARATWRGSAARAGAAGADDPLVDLWLQVDTCAPVTTYYRDADGDSYGSQTAPRDLCAPAAGWVTQAGDCNDNNALIRPSATEVCDGADNDCDTFVDAADASLVITICEKTLGVCAGSLHLSTECAGGLWQLCPNSRYGPDFETTETRCDGKDNDCDGLTDAADADLASSRPLCANQTGVCSGARSAVTGCVGGAWTACAAADYAANSSSYQSSETRCDGLDNDCNGSIDPQCADGGTVADAGLDGGAPDGADGGGLQDAAVDGGTGDGSGPDGETVDAGTPTATDGGPLPGDGAVGDASSGPARSRYACGCTPPGGAGPALGAVAVACALRPRRARPRR